MKYIHCGDFYHLQDKSYFFNFKKTYKTPGFTPLYYFLVFSSSFEEAVEKIKDYRKTTNCFNIWGYSAFTDGSICFPPEVASGKKEPLGTYFIIAEVIEEK